MNLELFKEAIRSYCGLVFEKEKVDILQTGINARMSVLGLTDPAAYYDLMMAQPDERLQLVENLTINETYFYREPAYLRLIVNRLVPDLRRQNEHPERLIILSAGCSSGEEAYSVAMALTDGFGPEASRLFAIIGVDIDSRVLARARRGIYTWMSFRGMAPEITARYFKRLPDGTYQLNDNIRQMVVFQPGNLLTDIYPDPNIMCDIILYRNVSIYFDPPTQRRIFANLAKHLRDSGAIIVSATETIYHNIGILTLVEADGLFYYRKTASTDSSPTPPVRPPAPERVRPASHFPMSTPELRPARPNSPPPSAVVSRGVTGPTIPLPPTRLRWEDVLAMVAEKHYDQALPALDRFLAGISALAEGQALRAYVLIELKRFDQARAACQKALEMDRWCLEAHLLLGLVEKTLDHFDLAIRSLREAVYIRSGCWPAHYLLAETYSLIGQSRQARREYEVTIRQLEEDPAAHGLTWLQAAFNPELVANLTRHRLEQA